jgi:exopolysaccharide biosynthesis polyprenyl glycosylphosphotransferase
MRSSNQTALRLISALLNASIVLGVLIAVFVFANWNDMPNGLAGFLAIRVTIKNLLISGVLLSGGALAFSIFGLTRYDENLSRRQEILRVIQACSVTALLAFLFPLTSHTDAFTRKVALYFLPAAILACLLGRFVSRLCIRYLSRTLNYGRDFIIVGSGPRALRLHQRIKASDQGFRILGFVDSPNGHPVPELIRRQMIGTLDDLDGILMKHPVDEVLIALPAKSCYEQIQSTIHTCERAGVHAKFLSDIFEPSFSKMRFEHHETMPLVSFGLFHDDARLGVKRAIDMFGALAGLIVLAPMMLAIGLAVRLSSPGPALFVQERFGLNKRRFKMYKFRTMVKNADSLQQLLEDRNEKAGPIFKIKNDPRVTRLGRFLRISSLDELPQLINVLQGHMSLVGPRPMSVRDVLRFDNSSLMRRFSVKPGLTCLWQVNGRSNTDFPSWIALDLQYIDTWSLTLDLQILAKTVPAVLSGRGAV